MDEAALSLLKADVTGQVREIEKIYGKITQRSRNFKEEPARLESLAYQLHNLYCAFEDLFKIVADYFENYIKEPSVWHRELLRRMSLDVEGVRPAVISETSYNLLNELRAFRHFLRHAYSYELDPVKIGVVLERAFELKDLYKEDIETFLEKIAKIVKKNKA